MPGKIQQSLGMLTSYLQEENKRLDQEIKDKSLDVFLTKASGVFKTLDADATPDDARERYYQLLGIAGNMEVGKEATPFLNQMLSSSVAFIKDNEAKKHDQGFRKALNTQLGYSFGEDVSGEDASKVIGLDISSTKLDEGYYDIEGRLSSKVYKLGAGGYREVQSLSKDNRTDDMKQKRELELLRAKGRVSAGNQKLDIRPSTYTFKPNGSDKTLPVDWSEDLGYFYRDPSTNKRVPANSNEGTFDQKMSSATINNSTRGTIKMDLETAQFNVETYGKGLALVLKNNQSGFAKNVYDVSAMKYIGGNESFLYANKDRIANEILNKYPTEENISPELREKRDSDLSILNSFIAQYDNYLNVQGKVQNFSEDITNKPQVDGVQLNEINKEANDMVERVLNPKLKTNPKAYKKILEIVKKHKGFYHANRNTPYNIWSGQDQQNKLSPEQRAAILTEVGTIIMTERDNKRKEEKKKEEAFNKVKEQLWNFPKINN